MDYATAQQRVRAIKGFYIHLVIYMTVIAFLYLLDLLTGDGWWFYYPAIGWGIAVAINAVVVLLDTGVLSSNWEEHKIKELMSKGGE